MYKPIRFRCRYGHFTFSCWLAISCKERPRNCKKLFGRGRLWRSEEAGSTKVTASVGPAAWVSCAKRAAFYVSAWTEMQLVCSSLFCSTRNHYQLTFIFCFVFESMRQSNHLNHFFSCSHRKSNLRHTLMLWPALAGGAAGETHVPVGEFRLMIKSRLS